MPQDEGNIEAPFVAGPKGGLKSPLLAGMLPRPLAMYIYISHVLLVAQLHVSRLE
jgi:hypothetical protein